MRAPSKPLHSVLIGPAGSIRTEWSGLEGARIGSLPGATAVPGTSSTQYYRLARLPGSGAVAPRRGATRDSGRAPARACRSAICDRRLHQPSNAGPTAETGTPRDRESDFPPPITTSPQLESIRTRADAVETKPTKRYIALHVTGDEWRPSCDCSTANMNPHSRGPGSGPIESRTARHAWRAAPPRVYPQVDAAPPPAATSPATSDCPALATQDPRLDSIANSAWNHALWIMHRRSPT
jgi:hypothetical protein